MTESVLNDVKTLLEGTTEQKLGIISKRTEKRLEAILGVSSVPSEFEYIVYEVTLKRFNRIGNEGMTSYSQEGLSLSFPESDFSEYLAEINDWKNKQADENDRQKRGRFKLY